MNRWFCAALVLLCSRASLAAEPSPSPAVPPPPPPPSDAITHSEFRPSFVLQTARVPPPVPHPELLRARVNGEYQIRLAKLTDLPLYGAGEFDSLGQTERLYHWLRVTPRLMLGEKLEVVAQLDVPEGLVLGQEPLNVSTGDSMLEKRNPVRVEPRWLYVDLSFPFGRLRAGQAPFHAGFGMVANDGDHPTPFGDYEGGAKFERVELRLGHRKSRVRALVAADLVYEDERARLIDGDLAYRGTLGIDFGKEDQSRIGVFGIFRHQRGSERAGRTPVENEFLIDSNATFSAKIAGSSGFVFGGYEVATRVGDSSFVRALSGTVDDPGADLRGFGAIARLGAVLVSGRREARWGSLVMALEWGYASGDDDPLDGSVKSFRFDPNYNVGLILFDEVLRWKTARSRALAAGAERISGADLEPSNGAVFGATYVHPTLIVRPVPELDLKAGAVLAQATSDFVDPGRLAFDGRYRNYDDGDASARDLGLELDAGVEYRLALASPMTLELGAQGALFFPGHAFTSLSGQALGTQAQIVGRIGLQY